MKKSIFITIILLFIVLGINIHLRLFPAYFPQFVGHAKNIVQQKIRFEAVQEINNKFANFSPLAKDKLLKNLEKNIYQRNKKELNGQIQAEYLRLKDRYQDARGQTYLMELDCWHWARYTENTLRNGHPGDKVVDGRELDSLMFAPTGEFIPWDRFLYYLTSFLYKIYNFFRPVQLFTFFFYLPVFFTCVFLIALFFYSSKYGGSVSGALACMFVGLSQLFIPRSCAGWYDKDILNLFFPLMVVWAYLLSLNAPDLKRKFFWLVFSSLWLGLFCFNWPGWWFVLLVVLIYEGSMAAYLLILPRFKPDKAGFASLLKNRIIFLAVFLGLSLLWILVFCGAQPLTMLASLIKDAVILNKPLTVSIWPNVFSTVGELRKTNYLEMIRSSGGKFLFILSVLSMIFVGWNNRKDKGIKRDTFLILLIWFFSMSFAAFKGIRFVVFLTLPMGVFLGWGITDLYKYISNKNKLTAGVVSLCLIAAVSFNVVTNGFKTARNMYPLMDNVWYKLLNVIRENTPPQAILNSWWDFGDWFKVVARRGVIFDGQSQNVPQAYWMARCILSGSEDEAYHILRMLNNGGNQAFDRINSKLKDPYRSVLLLEKLLSMDIDQARAELLKVIPEPVASEVLDLLFKKPGQAYFVADPTMPSKISAISFLGSWDFIKVYLMQNIHKKEKEQVIDYLQGLGISRDNLLRLYQEADLISNKDMDDWVSTRYQFFSGLLRGQERDKMVYFENGFIYNPEQKTIYLYNNQDGQYRIPRSLFIVDGEDISETVYPNPSLNFSIAVFKNASGYNAVALSRELGKSMFVRLYYFNGVGLKHFKLFAEGKYERDSIKVFKIKWD